MLYNVANLFIITTAANTKKLLHLNSREEKLIPCNSEQIPGDFEMFMKRVGLLYQYQYIGLPDALFNPSSKSKKKI